MTVLPPFLTFRFIMPHVNHIHSCFLSLFLIMHIHLYTLCFPLALFPTFLFLPFLVTAFEPFNKQPNSKVEAKQKKKIVPGP